MDVFSLQFASSNFADSALLATAPKFFPNSSDRAVFIFFGFRFAPPVHAHPKFERAVVSLLPSSAISENFQL